MKSTKKKIKKSHCATLNVVWFATYISIKLEVSISWAPLVTQMLKNLSAMQEARV